uniref:DB domain-containing protein n=1 Tax=Angiostrongylus costaricensis TaxID=334426 RepID=A0A0R3PTW2_ANGCS
LWRLHLPALILIPYSTIFSIFWRFQCAVNGICGVQPYCASYAPPVQPCQCVSAAYACGRYGCYRLVLRYLILERTNLRRNEPMSESEELEIVSPSIAENRRKRGPINPNRAFFECCMDRQLPDACLAKCNFRSYTREALTSMYFKQDPCPMEAMSEMQFCAAQGRDHADCCARNGVTTTLAGMKCLTLCNQRLGHPIRLDMSYAPCLDRFENMKACFWHDMTRFY